MNNLKGFSAVSEKEMMEISGGRAVPLFGDTNPSPCPPPLPMPMPLPPPKKDSYY